MNLLTCLLQASPLSVSETPGCVTVTSPLVPQPNSTCPSAGEFCSVTACPSPLPWTSCHNPFWGLLSAPWFQSNLPFQSLCSQGSHSHGLAHPSYSTSSFTALFLSFPTPQHELHASCTLSGLHLLVLSPWLFTSHSCTSWALTVLSSFSTAHYFVLCFPDITVLFFFFSLTQTLPSLQSTSKTVQFFLSDSHCSVLGPQFSHLTSLPSQSPISPSSRASPAGCTAVNSTFGYLSKTSQCLSVVHSPEGGATAHLSMPDPSKMLHVSLT